MMKFLPTTLCCALMIGTAQADDHWYGALSGGATLLDDDFSAHGLDYNGQSLPNTRLHGDFGTGYFAGAAIGRTLGDHWRLETEFMYHENDLDNIKVRADGGLGAALGGSSVAGARLGGHGDFETTSLIENAFYDFHYGSFRPYFGAGIGVAHVTINDARITHLQRLQALAPVNDAALVDSGDTVFAYQIGAGIAYPICPRLMASIDYRFLDAVDPGFHGDTSLANFHTQYRTNNVGVSLRFDF